MKLAHLVLSVIMCSGAVSGHAQGNPADQPAQSTAKAPEAGTPQSATAQGSKTAMPGHVLTPEEAARKYVEMWNTGNFEIQKEIYAPSVVLFEHEHRNLLSYRIVGRVITVWRRSMPDLKFTVEDAVVQGDKVLLRLSFTGTYKERLLPFTLSPSNFDPPAKIRSGEMLLFEVKNGRITQIWDYKDEMRLIASMGGRWRSGAELDKAMEESKAQMQNAKPDAQKAPEAKTDSASPSTAKPETAPAPPPKK